MSTPATAPTDYEWAIARTISRRFDPQHKIAQALARYRIQLVGLDGKTPMDLSEAVRTLEEIREAASAGLQKLRAVK